MPEGGIDPKKIDRWRAHLRSDDRWISDPSLMRSFGREPIRKTIQELQALVFPQCLDDENLADSDEAVTRLFNRLADLIHQAVMHQCRSSNCAERLVAQEKAERFFDSLAEIQKESLTDADAAYQGDPAARNLAEIISTYPGFYATLVYRMAHRLDLLGVPLLPRMMAELAHSDTGIDIHPGAHIGHHFFIDHGTGVVIGETTEIGDRVTLYQGVTLGALNFPHDGQGRIIRGIKRHPTIEHDVVIYSEATILGGDTVIGHDSVIGGNVWLTDSVPPFSKVTTKSTIALRTRQEPVT